MALTHTQDNRSIKVDTDLGKDVLLLVGFTGSEAISRLFSFQLDLLSEDRNQVKFEKVLGKGVAITVVLPGGEKRFFHGICNRFSQGQEDGDGQSFSTFTNYRMEVVPQFWLLTKRQQSRIFQQLTVPEILKKVLEGLDVSFEIGGSFEQRDYCVQYRESDFAFASRLMEEEGIFYFFKHTQGGHKMVVSNTPQAHPDLPTGNEAIYETITGGIRPEDRIHSWEKTQEVRSGKVTLWDHTFELPHKHLEGMEPIQDSVAVGEVTHKLRVANNDKLEIYDYPGAYAQRFDGIDKGGGEQPAKLQKVFQDNKRTTEIRIQQESLPGLEIHGYSSCRQFSSGFKFKLKRHYDADGKYILTGVQHAARLNAYRSGDDGRFDYQNTFTCIPAALPFRPLQVTPKARVHGTQTAVVVGPSGEEIFTDKYGRVKVQFHWDREGKNDASSSCWIRVAQNSAGRSWGSIFLPRIGHEVIVDFLEGDPDQPIIVGSVYNASEMPPYELPKEKTKTVIFKSNSTPGGNGFNEIRIEDKKGKEQIFVHGERNQDIRIKANQYEAIGNESHLIIEKDQLEKVKKDKHQHVIGDLNEKVEGTVSLRVLEDQLEKVDRRYALEVGSEIHLKAGMSVIIEAGTQITLKAGGSFIDIGPGGVYISGTMIGLNSGGAPGSGQGAQPEVPKDPAEADDAKTGKKSEVKTEKATPIKPAQFSPPAKVMQQAAQSGAPFCEICAALSQVTSH